MQSAINGEHVTRDPPADGNPSFFSWRWWALFFSALKFWKYTPKEMGVWGVSSLATDAKWLIGLGAFKAVPLWVAAKLPWLFPFLKAVWAKVVVVTALGVKTIVAAFTS